MRFVAVALRFYSYLYHAILCLFVFGICVLAYASHNMDLKLGMVPYSGEAAWSVLFYSSVIGLLSLLLAITGLFRFLFPVWTLIALIQMVRWLLLSGYAFPSKSAFEWTLFLILGAFGAFLSALQLFKSKARLRAERGMA